MPRMTPFVKGMLIASVVGLLAYLGLKSAGFNLAAVLGFVPARVLDLWLWQPFTYVLLHGSLLHLLFNGLILWSLGSELEAGWGTKLFGVYWVVCGLGAALTYGIFSVIGIGPGPVEPVIGSSGAVYGLLAAYGILYGDRPLYFFMLFPMPARYFVLVLGGVELISSVFYSNAGVAHLAHLGGMITGVVFLAALARWRQRMRGDLVRDRQRQDRQQRLQKSGHLKLVQGKGGRNDDDGGPASGRWN